MNRSATFLWAARLLRYPDEELHTLARERGAGEPDMGPPPPWAAAFLERAAATPLLDLQADFVRTFDHSAAASLYLTTHVYGHSPLQGRALAALLELYRDGGCEPAAGELPDYLPMALEFLAVAPPWAAACLCEKFAPVAEKIAAHLAAQCSLWAATLEAAAQAMRACAPDAAQNAPHMPHVPHVPDKEDGHAMEDAAERAAPAAADFVAPSVTSPGQGGPCAVPGAFPREVTP